MTRVGLFRAPVGLRSFSMDRYAESLRDALRGVEGLDVAEVRPDYAGAQRSHRIVNGYVRYPVVARRARFDVNHVLDHAYGHLVHVLDRRRTIVSCHDIFPIKQWLGLIPGLERRARRPVLAEASLTGLRRSAAIVTGSEATRDDLIEVLGIPADQIHLVGYGIDPVFRPAPRVPDGVRRVLVVSTGSSYKNNSGAVAAFVRVARERDDVVLVRVGRPLDEVELAAARRARVDDRIEELGSIPESELAALYGRCDVLLHPSFYEGFGWPAAEAMASGLPCVLSTWRSLVEIAGAAALYADADDHDLLGAHVLRVLEDGDLADALRRRGLERAGEFTWQKTAGRVAAVYEAVLAASASRDRRVAA